MALTDATILRTLKLSEAKSDKQSIQYTGSEEYLIHSDTKDPPFGDVLANTASWPNLGNRQLPQVDDEITVNGVDLIVTGRELSYFKDNERAVLMSVRYDAKKEPEGGGEPEGSDPATWLKITVASERITKPAVGWETFAEIPAEGAVGEGQGARNSAGDPVDGLEEECSILRLKYTNTQVANPNFEQLIAYNNRCNDAAFLGGAQYTVRVDGWSAEYDQKNNTWTVSVDFLHNSDGWQIKYYDAGFNELIGGVRKAILDNAGNPVGQPVPLDNNGAAAAIGSDPYTLELYPYKKANLSAMFANCGI